jgi:hypothetical protein
MTKHKSAMVGGVPPRMGELPNIALTIIIARTANENRTLV